MFGWFALLPDEYKQLGKHMAAGAGFVSNLVLWSESGYFDNIALTKPLLHLWSLGIEEQFYLLWPLIAYFAWKNKLNILLTITIILSVSFYLNINGIDKDPIATFYSPQTRVWELLCGSALAWVAMHTEENFHGLSIIQSNILSVMGFILLVFAILLTSKDSVFPGWWALMPVGGAVLIIFAGAQAWINRVLLSSRVMVWLGLISFPLYLWHWPLLSFAQILEGSLPSRQLRGIAVIFAVVLAWLTYKFVEKPIKNCKKQISKMVALTSLMAVIGFFGLISQVTDGFSFREGKAEQKVLSEEFKRNDWSIGWHSDGCSKAVLKISLDCVANSFNDPQILLIGDSHSQGLYLSMAEMIKKRNLDKRIMRLGSYLPFYNATVQLAPGLTFNSAETNRALNFGIENPAVKTIVLSFRGVINLTSNDYVDGEEIKVPGRFFTIKGYNQENLKTNFERGLKDTIANLNAGKKQIVFLIDNPELGFHPKECVDMRRIHTPGWKVRSPCAVTREQFDIRNYDYRKIISRVLKEFPSVKVLDTADLLCDSNWCEARK
jgi:peptidoglycan/LPS O-acetylase OafA/YrhL